MSRTKIYYTPRASHKQISLSQLRAEWLIARAQYKDSIKKTTDLAKYVYFLVKEQGYEVKEIAKLLDVKPPRIITIIKKFEKRGGGKRG